MANLRKLRIDLGWSPNKLAVEAGLARSTARQAEEGRAIAPATAKAIADALSKAYGRTILPTEIEGLNIE
jgi:transcriptional regulator with XRE-family HTH domain